jgi:hypothetical protein
MRGIWRLKEGDGLGETLQEFFRRKSLHTDSGLVSARVGQGRIREKSGDGR